MTNATTDSRATSGPKATGGKFLTFFMGREEYGIEIMRVREIMGLMPVTTIPRTPHFVRGVINLRGGVIPVVDLRMKFGLEAVDDTEESCIIVVQAGGILLGLVVDRVSEVRNIPGDDVVGAETLGAEIRTDYLLGMERHEGRVCLLLKIERVFSAEDLADLQEAA